MNGNRISLEQFETTGAPSRPAPGGGLAPGFGSDLSPGMDLGGDLPAIDLPMGGPLADDGLPTFDDGGVPPMDEPLIRPAPLPEADPSDAASAALQLELSSACTQLAALIETIEAERAEALNAAVGEAANRVGEVGAQVIGTVIDQGNLAEIAAAVAEIAVKLPHDRAELRVADQDHKALASAIARHAPDTAITLVSDEALLSGQARMVWPDGGADFDSADLTATVAPLIAERLSDLMTRSIP